MYSYLMSGGWSDDGSDTISFSRYYSDKAYPFVRGAAPAELLALPALFMPEVTSEEGQFARIGTISSARIKDKEVNLEYSFDALIPPIPVSQVVKLAEELGIPTKGFMLSHTHWEVHEPDLFKVLLRHGAAKPARPSVFDLDHEYDSKLVGVMMPFDPGFDRVYDAIKKGVIQAGFRCERADNLWLHHKVVQTIVSLICQSGIIVADCSRRNANVFYEAGIAHAIGKDVILIAQNIDDVPFDLQHLSIITYHPNGEGLQDLATKLEVRVQQISSPRRRA